MTKKKSGFTLIELVIALSLSSLVLVAIVTIASQMVRNQMEGVRSGTATGWSLVSYMTMAKEIEGGSVLAYPAAAGAQTDEVLVCTNWSRRMSGADQRLDAAVPVVVTYYCLDTSTPGNFLLRRFEKSSNTPGAGYCPNPGATMTCNASPPAPYTQTVIGYNVERLAGATIFQRDDAIGGLRVRYVVGRQTPTANEPNPKSIEFNYSVAMQKIYKNTID